LTFHDAEAALKENNCRPTINKSISSLPRSRDLLLHRFISGGVGVSEPDIAVHEGAAA
jgi:hypothetical protein